MSYVGCCGVGQGAHARERLLSAMDFRDVGREDLALSRALEAQAVLHRLFGRDHPFSNQAARFLDALSKTSWPVRYAAADEALALIHSLPSYNCSSRVLVS